jgi:cobaltochelatase CobN
LAADGYAATVPDAAELMRALTDSPADAVLSLEDYCTYLSVWPADAVARIHAAWGPAESDSAYHDGAFRFRVVQAGNAVVALQPDRGLHTTASRSITIPICRRATPTLPSTRGCVLGASTR